MSEKRFAVSPLSVAVCLGGVMLLILALPIATASAAECTNTWTGPAEGTWQTAGNWSTGKVPSETDVACIPSGKTVTSSNLNHAGLVQGEGSLKITTSQLEILGTKESASSINSLTISGGQLRGAGNVVVSNTFSWTGGTMTGVGSTVIQSGASGTIAPGGTVELNEKRHLVNEGTTTLSSGILELFGNTPKIENSGTFTVNSESSPAIKSGGFGGWIIVNTGTLRKTSGTGTSPIQVPIENKGTVNAQVGQISFTGGGSSSSTNHWEAAEGAKLRFVGTYALTGGTLSGTIVLSETTSALNLEEVSATGANVELSGGAWNVTSGSMSVNSLSMSGGSVKGLGTLKVSSSLTWTGGTMTQAGSTVILPEATGSMSFSATAFVSDGRHLVNEGTTTLSSGKLELFGTNSPTVENKGTLVVNSESAPAIKKGTGTPLFVNSGAVKKTSGAGTTTIEPPFENYGTLKEETGALVISNPIAVPSSNHFGCHCHAGDPVDSATGDFSESQTDFAIGGRGIGLVLTRTYSAQVAKAGTLGAFGYGWSNSFSDKLTSEEGGQKVTLTQGDGSTVPFTESTKGVYAPKAWSQDTLTGSSESGYTLTLPDQTKYKFSTAGKLESVTDRNGNETTVAYNKSGQLETITDPVGRKITLTYTGEGLVESAKDPMGHVFKYTYESKQLKTVTLPGEASANWQFKYDGSHRMTSMTDGRGGKTTNEYDGSSRVTSQTDPLERKITFEYAPFHTKVTNKATGAVTDQWFTSNNEPFSITRGFGTASATTETFAYNTEGRMVSRTDGNGHKTTYAYDEKGNRISETDAAENQVKWTYNETHDVLTKTTPEGEKTTITRDGQGNPETVSRPAPEEETQTISFEYGTHGELEALTDPLERTWSFEYDSKGNRKAEIDPEGDKRTWAYDEDSRISSIVSPRGNEEGAEAAKYTTTIERDAQGRPKELINPLERTTKYVYDANGNLETETDANSHKVKVTYDAANEPTKVELPNGDVSETGYDGAGMITSQTDANKHKTSYVRDILGQPIEIIDPLERKTTQEFDAVGNLKSLTDPAKRKTSLSYDAADRLKEVSYSDGVTPTVKYVYNKDSNLTSMIDGTGESTYEYDQLGRMIESENGHGDTVGYEFDLAGQLTELVYPSGKAISRSFDGAGRLEAITDWLGKTTTFAYNRDSLVKSTTFPEGTSNVDEYAYDRTDLLSEVKMKKGAETLASLAYTREKVGQIESLTSKSLPGGEAISYEYDANNRLSKAGAGSYEYDAANALTKTPTSTNTYDKASQLETGTGTTYTYDEEGERTKLTPAEGPATIYKYNQAGQLTAVERSKEGAIPAISESYAYEGSGLRASQTVSGTTSYLTWDTASSGLPLILSDGKNSYIYGPSDLPVEHISSEESPSYYHHDQLGSTRMLTNGSGEATGTFSYAPYGKLEGSTGSSTTPMAYAGQYTDQQSGLQYLRARFYDPETGQFLTRDPIEDLTREPYAYAHDNPLSEVDPSGLCGFDIDSLNPFSDENCAYQLAQTVCDANAIVGSEPGILCGDPEEVRNKVGGLMDHSPLTFPFTEYGTPWLRKHLFECDEHSFGYKEGALTGEVLGYADWAHSGFQVAGKFGKWADRSYKPIGEKMTHINIDWPSGL